MEAAFSHPIKKVLANFKVDDSAGLTDSQVVESRGKHGSNGTQTPSVYLPLIQRRSR